MKYQTLGETLLENAARHRENGDRHLREGRPQYAQGSYRKAEKNLARAKSLDVDPFLEPMIDRMAQRVAAVLVG